MKSKEIYWVELTRFDTKPDKSTWLEMGHELANHGYKVSLLTSYEIAPYVAKKHDVAIVNIKPSTIPLFFRIGLLFRSIAWLTRGASRNAIVIISPAGLLGTPFLRMFGFKRIHLDVRTIPVTVRGLKRKLDKIVFWTLALKAFHTNATTYSFISSGVKSEVETVTGCKFDTACIWSSGVDSQKFSIAKRKFEDAQPYRLFYHGTVTRDRGMFELVEAINLVDARIRAGIALTIIGPGPDLARLRNSALQLRLEGKVHIEGFVPYEDIPEKLRLADNCICPLPPRLEWEVSSPLKIFEYMASAKPIIATRISAHEEVLKSEQFVTWIDEFNSDGIAAAIEKAFNDRHILAEQATVGPELVSKKYSWCVLADKFSVFFANKYG